MYPESQCDFRAELSAIDRHGVRRATASGEMQKLANPSAHRLQRPNQGFSPGQQGRTLKNAAKDRLPPDSPKS